MNRAPSISFEGKRCAAGRLRLAGLFGTGRSGTTWLGAVLNAHPDVAYRFEPFHRNKRDPVLAPIRDRLRNGGANGQDMRRLYERLIGADPFTDKPPFFPKHNSRNFARKQAWFCARVCPPLRPMFSKLYSPREDAVVVFKEVTMERMMRGLLLHTDVPVVYLVRHPCATVASLVRGQEEGKMSTGRLGVLASLMQKHDPTLHEQYAGTIDQLNVYQKNALLWRMDVEKALCAIRDARRGLLITFEELCDDAHRQAKRVCDEFGIEFADEIKRFVDQLYAASGPNGSKSKDVRDRYFTVFRNPGQQRDKWKDTLAAEHRQDIEAIVCDSFAFTACATQGGWT